MSFLFKFAINSDLVEYVPPGLGQGRSPWKSGGNVRSGDMDIEDMEKAPARQYDALVRVAESILRRWAFLFLIFSRADLAILVKTCRWRSGTSLRALTSSRAERSR